MQPTMYECSFIPQAQGDSSKKDRKENKTIWTESRYTDVVCVIGLSYASLALSFLYSRWQNKNKQQIILLDSFEPA